MSGIGFTMAVVRRCYSYSRIVAPRARPASAWTPDAECGPDRQAPYCDPRSAHGFIRLYAQSVVHSAECVVVVPGRCILFGRRSQT